MIKKIIPTIFISLIYIILYLPILVLIAYAFNTNQYSLIWHSYTAKWYINLFHDNALWQALCNSLTLGVFSSSITTIMSMLINVFWFIKKKPYNNMYNLIYLMIIIPDLVLGIALLIFFKFLHMPLGFISLLIAHISLSLPFAIILFNTRVKTFNIDLYWSALDLGASPLKTFIYILLPLFFPAILSAFLLSFTLSFDDVMVSYFVAGPSFDLLPLKIYSLVKIGVTPELNALCTLILVFSISLILLAYKGLKT